MSMHATVDNANAGNLASRNDSQLMAKPGMAIAALAHQIRNPLTVAGLQLGLLAGDASEDLQDTIKKVADNLRRIEDCLQSCMVFSGGALTEKKYFTARQLSKDFQQLCQYTLSDSALEWHCLVDDEVEIYGNKKALLSALMNLVDNAEIACGKSLNLCVVISSKRDQLIIEVLDNGPGIPAGELRSVKAPFVSNQNKQGSERSHGLGLAITTSVVDAHQGEFVLLSDSGMGVSAVVRLPLVK